LPTTDAELLAVGRRPAPAGAVPARPPAREDPLTALITALATDRGRPASYSRTAKLFAAGVPKMAQKLVEEASEVAIEAVRGERDLVVTETADLLYNLAVLLEELGIEPAEVWAEIARREARYGVPEKLPKTP
jgi:phosphoribosyl-ATP pyrophosphohydrolase